MSDETPEQIQDILTESITILNASRRYKDMNYYRDRYPTHAPNSTSNLPVKLIYRGSVYYTSPTIIDRHANSIHLTSSIELTYRGQTYERVQQNVPDSISSEKPIELIYRGQTYSYTPPTAQPYCQPLALNWRFKVP